MLSIVKNFLSLSLNLGGLFIGIIISNRLDSCVTLYNPTSPWYKTVGSFVSLRKSRVHLVSTYWSFFFSTHIVRCGRRRTHITQINSGIKSRCVYLGRSFTVVFLPSWRIDELITFSLLWLMKAHTKIFKLILCTSKFIISTPTKSTCYQ